MFAVKLTGSTYGMPNGQPYEVILTGRYATRKDAERKFNSSNMPTALRREIIAV